MMRPSWHPHAAGTAALLLVLVSCSQLPSPSSLAPTAPPPTASAVATSSERPSAGPTPPDPGHLRLRLVADGLSRPIGITSAGDGSGRLFVNEQGGRIRVIQPDGTLRPEPFVDLSDRILPGGERGLLGVAFHPDFAHNRRLFVHYSRAGDGATVLSELHASADLQFADPASERVLLTVTQPFANHNGGQLAFGPDGFLYLGLGDGGGGGDPFGNAQNPDVLLGKILRLDVDGPHASRRQYALPPDNAFGPEGPQPDMGAPEVWAMGLRNPWRFSFDRSTGDMYIGDVGQSSWEEIDRQPAAAPAGRNYGWNEVEGFHCYQSGCRRSSFVDPIAEYGHDPSGGCSVSGGYVYRGTAQPKLVGVYVFGDYCSGRIWTLQVDAGRHEPRLVLQTDLQISAFGEAEDGELYVADVRGGGIYHVMVGG
jgi:glucose/arabinose dehydrogenase